MYFACVTVMLGEPWSHGEQFWGESEVEVGPNPRNYVLRLAGGDPPHWACKSAQIDLCPCLCHRLGQKVAMSVMGGEARQE